jgi:membrane protein involved in colicin uptake
MKNFASANTYLSAALALAAIVTAGALPASAQSRDHTGSMMPFYYEGTGEQKAGSWAAEEKAEAANKTANRAAAAHKAVAANKAAAANKQAAQTPRSLYLYAGKHSAHHGTRLD